MQIEFGETTCKSHDATMTKPAEEHRTSIRQITIRFDDDSRYTLKYNVNAIFQAWLIEPNAERID